MRSKHQVREFDVTDAVREATNLKIALFAPSGGGKTFTALRLAKGIQKVVGGDIGFIDTEHRRGLHYSDTFKFKHIDFKPPFASLDYLAAIKRLQDAGCKTIIIDSMSHEHEGEGGMIEYHEAEVRRLARGDERKFESVKMLAWGEPKAARRHLLNAGIVRADANLILCFRAKTTAKPIRKQGDDGRVKTEVVQMGFTPIAGDEFVFECDLAALFLPGAQGVPTWRSDQPGEAMMIKVPNQFRAVKEEYADKVLDEALGERLAKWAVGGVAKPKREEPEGDHPKEGAPSGSPNEAPPQERREQDRADESEAQEEELPLDDEAAEEEPDLGGFALFASHMSAVKDLKPWIETVAVLRKSAAWKEATEDMRNKALCVAYTRLNDINIELIGDGKAPIDALGNPHVFRCYLEFEGSKEALTKAMSNFRKTEFFTTKADDAVKNTFEEAFKRRIGILSQAAETDFA